MDGISLLSNLSMPATVLPAIIVLAAWGAPVAIADNGSVPGLTPISPPAHTAMDHAAMGHGQGSPGALSDPHLHHRQMMQRQAYTRSEHAYRAPARQLTDAAGRETSLSDLLDTPQPVMLNFIFTTCTTICPVLTATFSQIQEALGDRSRQVRMISVTIDPEQDTPEVLRRYAGQFGAGPQWHFLTGDIDSIIEVEKAFDIYRGSKTNHQPITLLRAPGKTTWVRIEGIASASDVLTEFDKLLDNTP